jgi:hypothetical protein
MYDSRIGRWLKTDELSLMYKSHSPYHAMYNNPIIVIDADGRENVIVVGSDNNWVHNEITNSVEYNLVAGKQMREHFLRSAAMKYQKHKALPESLEKTTILLYADTKEIFDDLLKIATQEYGVDAKDMIWLEPQKSGGDQPQVYISSYISNRPDVITGWDYLNCKEIKEKDLITDLYFIGHGSISEMYLIDPYCKTKKKGYVFNTNDYNDIYVKGSNESYPLCENAQITLEMCRWGWDEKNPKIPNLADFIKKDAMNNGINVMVQSATKNSSTNYNKGKGNGDFTKGIEINNIDNIIKKATDIQSTPNTSGKQSGVKSGSRLGCYKF